MYHCGLLQKLITSTEGSFDISGTNCALSSSKPINKDVSRVRTTPKKKKKTYAEHPFPTTPTRFPPSGTSCLHLAECQHSPLNAPAEPRKSSGTRGA